MEDLKKIDFVVTWVDGNDPEWLEERKQYISVTDDNQATENRFRDWNLMRYWFRGVEKFAPWVNRIYFVTCGHYPEWLNLDNPKLTLVKHSDYIPKEVLPTYNSNVIEMHLHRLSELSNQFVLFNDDTFLINYVTEEDFFKNGIPCESALLGLLSSERPDDMFPHIIVNNMGIINKYFDKKDVIKDNFSKFYSFEYGKDMLRNFLLTPFHYISCFHDLHLPASYLKESFCNMWEREPELMKKGATQRFRSKEDLNHWLIKNWQLCSGRFEPRGTKWGKRFELGRDTNVAASIKKQSYKVICVNDSNPDLDFDSIQKELILAFEQILPEKSLYEK